jgi:hypothetical protein
MGALSDPAGSEARSPCDISQPDDAVEIGANAIASLFTLVTLGERIDVDGTKEAGRMITNRISEHGLSEWLKTVRRHHEGTY